MYLTTRHLTPLIRLTEDIEAIRKGLNRAFYEEPMATAQKSWLMPVELTETPDAYHVRVLVPGINPDELTVEATEKSLSLVGEITPREQGEQERVHHAEFSYGRFSRMIEFAKPILNEQIEASYEHGVLTMRVPKKEAVERRTVQVRIASLAKDE